MSGRNARFSPSIRTDLAFMFTNIRTIKTSSAPKIFNYQSVRCPRETVEYLKVSASYKQRGEGVHVSRRDQRGPGTPPRLINTQRGPALDRKPLNRI